MMESNDTLSSDLNASNYVHIYSSMTSYTEEDSNNLTLYVFDLGPKRDSLASVIPITVIYVVILITGLVGNICTCVVIIRNKHMRSTTNYYLFSLAVSDLLLLVVGLPQELYLLWNKYPYIFGEAFCIIRGFTSEMSTNASILTITSFTVERYLAICHPIKAHTMSTLSRAVKLIVVVWIVGGLCAIPMAVQFGVVIKNFEGVLVYDTAECTLKNPIQDAFVSSTLCFFIIPMLIITVLYALIGIQLRASASIKGNDAAGDNELQLNVNGNSRQFTLKKLHLVKLLSRQSTRSIRGNGSSSRKAVVKMLLAVVIAFFLCWAPFHAQRLMAIYVQHQTPTAIMIYSVLTYISGVTYYVSATINPILYSIMSNKFRQAFKYTLAHCCQKKGFYDRSSSQYSTYRSSMMRSHNGCNNGSVRKKTNSENSEQAFRWKNVSNNNGMLNDTKVNGLD